MRTLSITIILCTSSAAFAAAPRCPPPTAAERERLHRQHDTDGDGELSPAERDGLHQEQRRALFRCLDQDGNGAITWEELDSGLPAPPPPPPRADRPQR